MFKYFNSVRKFSKKKIGMRREKNMSHVPSKLKRKKLYLVLQRERERLMKNMLRHRRQKKRERPVS